jgi:hypothetical protein
MNEIELIEDEPRAIVQAQNPTPYDLLAMAINQGADLDKLERLMALQERWEKASAERAYNEAMSAFKAEAVEIIKRKEVDFANKSGGRTNYKHAELSDVIEAVGPALSRHGLSWSWKPTQDKGWITVTCTLKHRLGHSESVSLSAPPDETGGKNSIQAIVSTTSYLERHTLKAICGVAEKGEDNDGGASVDEWSARLADAANEADLKSVKREGSLAFAKSKDVPGYAAFMKAAQKREAEIKGAA